MRQDNCVHRPRDIPRRVHRLVLHVVVVAVALFAKSDIVLDAQQIRPTEAQVKAAFLFNFGKYVTWPRVTGDTFSICILGQDPFGEVLDSIVAGEKLGGKPADVRRIRDAREASTCQIVFISSSQKSHLQSTLAELAQFPALTVSDIPEFVQRGGMIQFVDENDRVRFIVNLASAQKAGFVVSSELLKVAKYVQRESGPGGV